MLAALLSGCGGSGAAPVKSVSTPIAHSRPPARLTHPVPPTRPVAPRPVLPRPQVQVLPGLEGVIGVTGSDLERQFGPARLDVLEGDARKLQFASSACVLDVFLYPAAAGREPQATYVDARRPSDGRDVDRAACVAALRKR